METPTPTERRRIFSEYIRRSRYQEAKTYLVELLANYANESSAEVFFLDQGYAEVWGMLQRLRYLLGEVADIEAALEDRRTKPNLPDNAEVAIAEAHCHYHHSRYPDAYRALIRAYAGHESIITSPAPTGPLTDYAAMRLQLFAAKASWRRDDFPLATLHLGLAAFFCRRYHAALARSEDGRLLYHDYIWGCILTVYPRLLTQRRRHGQTFGKNNIDQAQEFIDAARLYFRDRCPLEPATSEDNGHLFEAELCELSALTCRNDAVRLANEGNSEESAEVFEKARDWVGKADIILGEQRVSKPSRRFYHLYRLEGENLLREHLQAGREGKVLPRRPGLAERAHTLFSTEIEQRQQALAATHVTIAQALNNRAFAAILWGHELLRPVSGQGPPQKGPTPMDLFGLAVDDAKAALVANGLTSTEPAEITGQIENSKGLSCGQTLSSYQHILEAKLRIAILDKEVNWAFFTEMHHLFRVVKAAERHFLSKMLSNSAREDVNRRSHPIYESMAEVCFRVQQARLLVNADRRKIWEKVIFQLMRLAVAPHLRFFVNRHERDYLVSGDGERVIQVNEVARREINLLRDGQQEGASNPEDIERVFRQGCRFPEVDAGKVSFDPEKPNWQVDDFLYCFRGRPGGMAHFLVGNRHLYVLCFGGNGVREQSGEQVVLRPKLLQLGTDAPYRSVGELKSKVKQLYTGKRDAVANDSEDNRQVRFGLKHDLYRALVAPILRALPGLERLYFIPDQWLWQVQWTSLLTRIPTRRQLKNAHYFRDLPFVIRDHLITTHASLDVWLDLAQSTRQRQQKETNWGEMCSIQTYEDGVQTNYANHIRKLGELFYEVAEGDNPLLSDYVKPHRAFGVEAMGQGRYQQFKDTLGRAEVIVLLGHGDKESRLETARTGFVLRLGSGVGEPDYLCLTQSEIESYDLRKVRLLLLLNCNGGRGGAAIGNVPKALFRAFLHAGVRNLIYCNNAITLGNVTAFTESFMQKCRTEGLSFGVAYRNALLEMELGGAVTLDKINQIGMIRFLGDQTDCLYIRP